MQNIKIDKSVNTLKTIAVIFAIMFILFLKLYDLFDIRERVYIIPEYNMAVRLYVDSDRQCVVIPSYLIDNPCWKDSIIISPVDRGYYGNFRMNQDVSDDFYIYGFAKPHLRCKNNALKIIEIQ